jgi:Chromo (CHRromatin Organisation MOdifier) domain
MSDVYNIAYVYGKEKKPKTLYFVAWEGYPVEQSTWEPLAHFNETSLLCLTRFERCLSYQQYYTRVKKSTTNGIRVHCLGEFTQELVPEIIYMRPKPEAASNREQRPIVKSA